MRHTIKVFFKIEFNKTQTDGFEEDFEAFDNFMETWILVKEHNKMFLNGEVSFELQVDSRADLSFEKKQILLNGLYFPSAEIEDLILQQSFASRADREMSFPPAPNSLDYRALGYVTEVVDQGRNSKD